LINDFGYSSNAVRRDRSSYNDNNWKGFIKEDLDNGRPVIYGSLFGGHYWVLDGYDSDDQFNFKWGWTGSKGNYDNWYTLNEITDIGGSNFRWGQNAIFKIYPAMNQDYCNYDLSLYDYYISKLALIMIYIYNGFSVPPEIWNAIHAGIPRFATTLTSVNPDLYPNSPIPIPEELHTIKAGQTVEYVASESIRLLPGFKVEAGAHFTARIEPCINCNSAKVTTKSLKNGVEIEEEIYIAVGDNEEEQPIGKDETVAGEPQVYPNPTTGLLTIRTKNDNSRVEMIELYDTQGTKLFTFNGNNGSFQEIDISYLPSQVYALKIQVNGQIFTKKLILRK